MIENLRTTAGQSASKAFPKEVKSVAALAKEVEKAYSAQRSRLESSPSCSCVRCPSRTGGSILLSILCTGYWAES
jgi:hypothetical protein